MKRLILLVMMLLVPPGCVSALISSIGYSSVNEIAAEGLSRTETQEKFGSPASSETTSLGRPVEIRYMRHGSGGGRGLFSPGIVAACLTAGYICVAVEWVDIAIAPFTLVAHEFNKFKILFVYGPDNKVLYLYDQNADARERYRQATMTTAGIERCAAPAARECVERYVEEVRKRAIEVNYQIDPETEQQFQFEMKTAQNWDDGKITEEEVNKRLALRQFYLSMVSLTDPLLESIRDGKCNVVETCVGDYIQQIRWKKVVVYDFTEEDEKVFNLELETARDADAGRITREQTSDRLREISTDQLKRLYDLVEG
jgi:hypothetical protein